MPAANNLPRYSHVYPQCTEPVQRVKLWLLPVRSSSEMSVSCCGHLCTAGFRTHSSHSTKKVNQNHRLKHRWAELFAKTPAAATQTCCGDGARCTYLAVLWVIIPRLSLNSGMNIVTITRKQYTQRCPLKYIHTQGGVQNPVPSIYAAFSATLSGVYFILNFNTPRQG